MTLRKVGLHQRAAWREDSPRQVRVSAEYRKIKGGAGGPESPGQPDYEAAKSRRDQDAAARLLDRYATDQWLDAVVDDVFVSGKTADLVLVWPMPDFSGNSASHDRRPITNALPGATAVFLADVLDARINDKIVQIARPGRTLLSRMERFLYQPVFNGEVETDCGYVLVDDMCTTGGTLAALRTHIVEHGGTVVGACALGYPEGRDQTFPPARDTTSMLLSTFSRALIPFWLEEVGHDIQCLTESEGRVLLDWWGRQTGRQSPLQQFRNCFDSVRSRGIER